MILRPYQAGDTENIHAAFAGGALHVLHILPTGGGKTVEFTEMASRAVEFNTRTAILVHRDTLLLQASRKLYECGVQHSVIAPGHRGRYGDMLHVASVQTLVRRLDRHEFDFLIVDEAHHAVSPTYRKIFQRWPEAHVLGVTATPIRTDGQGLNSIFDKMVCGPSIQKMIGDGYLVEPIAYGPAKPVELGSVRTRMGDYDQAQLAAAMDRTEITGDAVEHYRKLCPGAPAVAFCVNVKHAEDVAADFAAAGFRAVSVDGTMDQADIRRRVAGLSDGTIQVLTSCDLISEGFDAPGVVAAILLRPTKSLAVYLQQVGRALRPVYAPGFDLEDRVGRLRAIAASGKPNAVILDHAGNCFRHGMADDDREWLLEGRKKRGGGGGAVPPAIEVRQCPACFQCHKPGPACPGCGHVYVVLASEPEVVAGTLTQIDKAALKRARMDLVRAARSYPDLKDVARKLGYSDQWAWRTFCERGSSPSGARA